MTATNFNTCRIIRAARLNNSAYGNPRWGLTVETEAGEVLAGKTANNAAIGYFLTWTCEGKTLPLVWHCTRGGSIIFDRIAE